MPFLSPSSPGRAQGQAAIATWTVEPRVEIPIFSETVEGDGPQVAGFEFVGADHLELPSINCSMGRPGS